MNRKHNARAVVPFMARAIFLLASLTACQSTTPAHTVLFDSGRGTGPYDTMTYSEYESLIAFTPQASLTVRSLNPQINYCNGSCGYIVYVHDQNDTPLAYQTGLIDTSDQANPPLPERYLNPQVRLNAGMEYLIFIKVWATESVGIYTTGARTTGATGEGKFKVIYARSDLLFSTIPSNDTLDRGGVSFQLIY
ncbi:MAG: hypothetical protein A2W33_08175 [Chloroflexi bacterium RBG_16_52_11]|nr:MAG: hypothetical protein A2W33_08175 [Chloroflexi bacterium RBG_16_52_11]